MGSYINELKNNSFYETKWETGSIVFKTISFFKIENALDEFVRRFINIKTFPYVNTVYNDLLVSSFDELPYEKKIEVKAIIEKYLNELDQNKKNEFNSKTDDQLCDEYSFSKEDIKAYSREELFKSVKGGYYCEMLLYCILMSLGYTKIISKLYLQFGVASPTGVDAPFINFEDKTLILGECKIFKSITNAISSCLNDLDKLYNHDKFEREFKEWKSKYSLLNDSFRLFLESNKVETFIDFVDCLNETICLGFVVGNEINEEDLKNKLLSISEYKPKSKTTVLLIVIPIDSKDEFIEKCYNALQTINKEI